MNTDKLMQRAASVVDRVKIGVMMTVDADGAPHGRWMGATTRHGLTRLFTLTACETRKVGEIRANPRVCWLFTSPDYGDMVVLSGAAVIHEGGAMLREAWDVLKETGQTYGIGPLSDERRLEICVIETVVDQIELTSPELDQPTPRTLAMPAAD